MSENCNHNCEGCQADCGSRKADFKQPANKYSHIKKVIGVVSGKGGVGKSLVTCLLAAGCAKAGLKVGVLDADLSLYAQNYHAAERTYSLLAQVVGRAGRGERPGRAVIQTYHPENEVIQAAAKQDYKTFYQNELRMRSLRRYPPFADLFTLTVSGLDELRVIAAARALCDALRYASSQPPLSGLDVEVLGPAGAPVVKVNNRYRYCVYLCGKGGSVLRRTVSEYLLAFYARKENRGLDIFADCNALQ